MISDYGKFALFIVIILSNAVLRYAGQITEDTFRYVLVGIVFYLIGNGVQAVRGKAPSPVLVPKPENLAPDQLDALAKAIAPGLAKAIAANSPALEPSPAEA